MAPGLLDSVSPLQAVHTMKQIDTFIDNEFTRRSRNWKTLKDSLLLALPPDVLQRVVYAVVEDTTLKIYADSPAWTSKMRFYDNDIKKIFKQRGIVLRAIQTRTIPGVQPRKY